MRRAIITIEAPAETHREADELAQRIAARALTGVRRDGSGRVFGRVTGVTARTRPGACDQPSEFVRAAEGRPGTRAATRGYMIPVWLESSDAHDGGTMAEEATAALARVVDEAAGRGLDYALSVGGPIEGTLDALCRGRCSCSEVRACNGCVEAAEQLIGARVRDSLGREWMVTRTGEKDGFPTVGDDEHWDQAEAVEVLVPASDDSRAEAERLADEALGVRPGECDRARSEPDREGLSGGA